MVAQWLDLHWSEWINTRRIFAQFQLDKWQKLWLNCAAVL